MVVNANCKIRHQLYHYISIHVNYVTKVKATFPLMRRTLVPKGLQSRRGQFIHKFL